ncbi:MAG TPA: response regulator [Aliidongia sp.]|uniref:response regulator n=1 Tax=Aliidongia sp. TaxID=1914230 RepID=UPI002DDD06C0|nr:response regulator [Aliidongia sp.]HEV2673789.1 response regulator [Aliidongia sp.]
MIVDDSRLARIVLSKAIATLQPEWTQVEAGSTDDALAIVDRQSVDVAVFDYNMPGRDGLSLAGELRERFPVMPLAIVTANVQDEVIAGARAVNATFVSKPINEETLRGFLSGAALRLRSAGK